MNINKIKIVVVFGVLVLSAVVSLLIWASLGKPQSKNRQTSAPVKLSLEFPKPPSSSEKFSTFKKIAPESLNIPIIPIPKPDLEAFTKEKAAPDTVAPFFENINEAAKAVEKSLMPANAQAQKTTTLTSAGIILSLTKEQFHFLYPEKFIASLTDAQNLFIKDYDPGYETVIKIETDAQVRLIEEKIVATLLSANMITKERAEQFITTIRFTLPQLQLIDLQNYFNSYESSPLSKSLSALLGRKTESPRKAPKGLFLAGFMEKFKDALANKAQAAVCGTCSSLPLCFQEGAATPGVPGSELFYPSCYCTGCLTSLGCLSANTGQAAIYDQTTGICGVGL